MNEDWLAKVAGVLRGVRTPLSLGGLTVIVLCVVYNRVLGLATGPVAGARYNYAPASPEILEKTQRIEAVCRRHDVPLPAAALQFPLGHPAIAAIIPGTAEPAEVERNLAHFRSAIPADLWAELKTEGLLHPEAPVPT